MFEKKEWWEDPEKENWWEDPEHFLAKMSGPSSIGVRELFLKTCEEVRRREEIIKKKNEEIQSLKKQPESKKEEQAVVSSLVKLVESAERVEEDHHVCSNLTFFVTKGIGGIEEILFFLFR